MDAFLRFKCPRCDKSLKAPSKSTGKSATCPKCGDKMRVPAPQSGIEPPLNQSKATQAAMSQWLEQTRAADAEQPVQPLNRVSIPGKSEQGRSLSPHTAANSIEQAAGERSQNTTAQAFNPAPSGKPQPSAELDQDSAPHCPPQQHNAEREAVIEQLGHLRFFGLLRTLPKPAAGKLNLILNLPKGGNLLLQLLSQLCDDQARAFGHWLASAPSAQLADLEREFEKAVDVPSITAALQQQGALHAADKGRAVSSPTGGIRRWYRQRVRRYYGKSIINWIEDLKTASSRICKFRNLLTFERAPAQPERFIPNGCAAWPSGS